MPVKLLAIRIHNRETTVRQVSSDRFNVDLTTVTVRSRMYWSCTRIVREIIPIYFLYAAGVYPRVVSGGQGRKKLINPRRGGYYYYYYYYYGLSYFHARPAHAPLMVRRDFSGDK